PLQPSGLRLVITTSRDGSNLFTKQREAGVVVSKALPTAAAEYPTPLSLPPPFANLKGLGRSYARSYEEEKVSLRDASGDDYSADVGDDDRLSEVSDESDCSSDSSDSSWESDCFITHGSGEIGPRLFTVVGHGDVWGDLVSPPFLGNAVGSAANFGQVM
ncbi:hypothetical protein Pmar_PMAR008538, partial [Perkinsus marinus ATCC 50983]